MTQPEAPPAVLFHAVAITSTMPMKTIRAQGLVSLDDSGIQLNEDRMRASDDALVREPRLRPHIFMVYAGAMHKAGHAFRRIGPQTWATDRIPSQFMVLTYKPE